MSNRLSCYDTPDFFVLSTQREILCRERCSGDDQAPDEQKESGDEDHKCEANHRNKNEPDDRAEWLMISLTASSSRRDEVFGRDSYLHRFFSVSLSWLPAAGHHFLFRSRAPQSHGTIIAARS